ncbi:DUF1569 domain-containing protein [Mucilaginibacter sp.]|uniref:DUF1569 domain-containing protein n=1 Tax=Mucilaginibacter sp. TaxID=1882438 RepID=UPI003262DEAC
MKTTFDKATRDELVKRINTIQESTPAQWGKMNAYQMVKHCRQWEELITGDLPSKRVFIGRIFGKIALKSFLKDDSPMGRNSPTTPEVKAQESTGNFAAEKTKWLALIEQNANTVTPNFVHPFFGKMTNEQIGLLAYKHIDHHLRQFGA